MEMGFSRLLFFFYPAFIQLVFAMAQPNSLYYGCGKSGNFTTNSTYQSNLDSTLTSISSDTKINYGFYNDSSGQNTNKVNAIALCRGDKKPDICRSCIKNSSQLLRNLCPSQKEAIGWSDDCMLRYSNRSIFGKMEFNPELILFNVNNVSDVTQFNQVLNPLLASLTSRAASGDSLRKFATGNATTKNNQTIYALAQCTPDLSKEQCSDCLINATGLIPQCCAGKQGARVLTPSCNFRYEIELFYDSVGEAMPPSPTPTPLPVQPPSPTPLPVPPPSPTPLPVPPPSPTPPPVPPPSPTPPPVPPPSPPAAPTPQTPTGKSTTGKASNRAAGAFIASVFLVLFW